MSTLPLTPAARLAGTLAEMRAAVAARTIRPGQPGLPGWLILLIWTRLGRIAQRLARLFAHIAAGTLKPPRKRPPATRRPATRPPPAGARKLPRGSAWLLPLVPGIAFGRTRLEALFADPEMQALLVAAPQLGRSLRPLCHMLGLRPLPPLLRLPPKTPPVPSAPPASAKARRTPPAEPGSAAPPRARPPRKPRTRPQAPEVALPACVPPALAWVFG